MDIFTNINAPVQTLFDDITRKHSVLLHIKREDLNHPEIMGNKLRKLKYNLLDAQQKKASCLLSFGGAFSNHILALSAAGRIFNIPTIGIIRGAELVDKKPNLILAQALNNGMQLEFISRQDYKIKGQTDFINQLHKQFGDFYLLPEGGSNALAVQGVAEIMDDIDDRHDVITCACGTGGTLAGLIQGAHNYNRQALKILGFQVLKADGYIQNEVKKLLAADIHGDINWQVNSDFHFGGYAKTDEKLIEFIRWFKTTHDIELDYIYTGKMMYGLYQMIQSGFFRRGSKVLAIHTGGTQTASLSCLRQI